MEKENQQVYSCYCGLATYLENNKLKATVLLGSDMDKDVQEILLDENGEHKVFNDQIDVLNYMGKRGWRLIQYTENAHGRILHYTLEKRIISEEQIKEGLYLGIMKRPKRSLTIRN